MENTLMSVDASSRKITGTTQLVSFLVGKEGFGVDVSKVREIIRVPEITKVPNAPAYMEGIFNLRGTVVPILSLRRLFGLNENDRDKQTRIMVMDVRNGQVGFVVDAVSEVIRLSREDIQPPPHMTSADERQYITGVLNHRDHLLIMMDSERILPDTDDLFTGRLH